MMEIFPIVLTIISFSVFGVALCALFQCHRLFHEKEPYEIDDNIIYIDTFLSAKAAQTPESLGAAVPDDVYYPEESSR